MAKPSNLSKEHEQFCSLMKCPLCDKFPIIPNYFQNSGKQVPKNTPLPNMDISTIAECPRCKKRWSVFASSNSPPEVDDSSQEKITRSGDVSIFEFTETDRWEESLGSDLRLIDNSKGSGSVTRKLTVNKEWSKNYAVEFEKAVKVQGEMNFDIVKIISLKTTIEGNLKKKYSISENTKYAYTDEVSVEIKPSTKVSYRFKWKRVWQNGLIKCLDQSGQAVAFIPFQVVVGVTFDIESE